MALSRRTLILGTAAATGVVAAGAGAAALVENGTLPGKSRVDRLIGRCDIDVPAADAEPGTIVQDTFDSELRRGPVAYSIAYPPGAEPGDDLAICLLLHGYASTGRTALDAGNYPRYLAAHVRAGGTPFVLAAMDGGTGYWHPHTADDPLGALLDEFVPLLGRRGLDTGRLGALGFSMGGYGALLCALTAPEKILAVAASAPAFWRSYAEADRINPGAFDSAEEWVRYDVLGRAAELDGRAVRIDCGESDPFAPVVRTLQARLTDPGVVHLAPGCHDERFWQSAAPAQLSLLGTAFAVA